MKTLFALTLCALLAAPAGAQVGETMGELKLRYGPPLEVEGTKETRTDHATFQYGNYRVVVTLRDGRSAGETITRRDRRDFTQREVQEFLEDAGFSAAVWRRVSGTSWTQRGRTAVWASKTFTVTSDAWE
jgi:hypothetical protein